MGTDPAKVVRTMSERCMDICHQADAWKVLSFTRDIRATFGYCEEAMSEFGFNMDLKWPNIEVPDLW